MAPRDTTRPEPLGQALNRTLQHLEGSYPDQAHRIWDVWKRVVAEPLASRCCPLEYRHGTLVLGVSSSAWMQQVQFLTATVRDAVNRALGEELVQQVRLRVAEAPPPPPPAEPPPLPPTDQLPPLPREDRDRLEAELQQIPDPEVRAAVRRARERGERLALFMEDPAE